MNRPNEFTPAIQQLALTRQRNRCASCGTTIFSLGKAGQARHAFGEIAHAHHVRHIKLCGNNSLDNCVILCWSCHYSVHEGGNYRWGKVMGEKTDYRYFNG